MAPRLQILPDGEDLPDGDEGFVAQLTQHQTSLLGFLLSLVTNQSDAEDLLQRTNLVLWRKRGEFVPGTSFRSWAFTVARWEARAHYRTQSRKSWLVYDDEVADLVADRMASVSAVTNTRKLEALRKCLDKLSNKNRQLIVNRYLLGFSNRECAEKMQRSEAGLRVTLHRLRTSLRKCVANATGNEKSRTHEG
jgi:RNA polymerase sigma-70 factor (ECF subfamily)